MSTPLHRFGIAIMLTVAAPVAAAAQWDRAPERGGLTRSIGQPLIWRWHAGLAAGGWFGSPGNDLLVRAEAGVYRDLLNPVSGLAGAMLEGYAGMRGTTVDGGLRAMLRSPYLGTAIGVDYNVDRGRADLLIALQSPVRRGGLVFPGGLLRLNWYPMERHGFTLGLNVPVGQPFVGRSRPVVDHVLVAAEPARAIRYPVDDAALEALLDSTAAAAEWVRRLVVPFLDHDGRNATVAEARVARALDTLASRLALRNVDDEVRAYHRHVEAVFAHAAGDPVPGRAFADSARAILLEEVLLPYNRLLGRKKRQDALHELGLAARGRFARATALIDGIRRDALGHALQRLLEDLDRLRARSAREWDDPRLVWLPLQLALRPEDHDTPAELEALIARATGSEFSGGNRIWYLANLQFHWELLRMIREAEDYHVLWIHDFPAITDGGLDWASATQVADGYLTALAERVEAYDRTGRLPLYFIFLDQHYYEERKSRLFMTLLEDPLGAEVRWPPGADVARIEAARERLRRAVAGSRVLQAEARQYGRAWLRNRIKVHVNITYQADASFWGGGLVSSVFGYPDNVMRDHRKVAFYDVTDGDPDRGMAMYTGMGVGQQYLGSGWEDRSLLVRGPALAHLRRAARELLLSQGMRETDLPRPFRGGPTGGERSAAAGDGRAMELHNLTGYAPKPLNVAKAVFYSLLPPGAVVKVPDSLWNSMCFAGLLVGATLRGVRVQIVAPALANAPSNAFPQMARAHELYVRLLLARDRLGPAIASAGGRLDAGLYALEVGADGFGDRLRTWERRIAANGDLRELMPFIPQLEPVVTSALASDGEVGGGEGPRHFPRLHHKVQFFATPSLWDAVAAAPEWPDFLATYLEYRRVTFQVRGEYRDARTMPERLEAIATRLYRGALARSGPGAAAWAIVGSQNQDNRGMFMDGEVGLVLTGPEALVTLVDLVFLDGAVEWLEDRATLDRLLPPPTEFRRRLGRVAKDAV